MADFQNLWEIINNFLSIEFTLYGFHLTWGNILLYSLLGSLVIGVIIHIFKAHE